MRGLQMLEIREVLTKKELKKFACFKQSIYKGNQYYAPDMIADEMAMFDKKNNPAYAHCESRCFLAYNDGKIVGRIAAIINDLANEKWKAKKVRFSNFDFIDDPQVSKALMEEVEKWAKEKGMNEIHGPLGFCDVDKEGMLVEGFEENDMFITIYNHPYYAVHMDGLGFAKDVDWVEYQLTVPREINEKVNRLNDIVLRRNHLTLLRFKKIKEISPYVPSVFKMIDQEYGHLYGTVPLTDAQVEWYYKSFFSFLNPDFIRVIIDRDKKMAAFGVAVPSLAKAAKKSKGRLLPFGIFRMLRAIKKNDTLELFLVAVRSDLQGKGINAILMHEFTRMAIKYGMKFAETGPELELNTKVQSMWSYFEARQHRRRRCFAKKLG
jgi:GNAT superfamily N-acetyltransferase